MSGAKLGPTVPGWSIRALFAAIALGVCGLQAVPAFWLAVAVLLAGVAVAAPRLLTAWFLIGVLSFSVLLAPAGSGGFRALALVAALHALHLCASWMLVVPATARLQPAALLGSARRFVVIQLPVQALGALVVWMSGAAGPSPVPVLAVVAGAAVAALVVVLAGPMLRRSRP